MAKRKGISIPTAKPKTAQASKRRKLDIAAIASVVRTGTTEDLQQLWESVHDDGCTLLHVAAKRGCLDMVQSLVCEGGAAANQAKNNGATPL